MDLKYHIDENINNFLCLIKRSLSKCLRDGGYLSLDNKNATGPIQQKFSTMLADTPRSNIGLPLFRYVHRLEMAVGSPVCMSS